MPSSPKCAIQIQAIWIRN